MKAFFRSISAFKHLGSAQVLSFNLCLDSSDGENGSLVVDGEFGRALIGQWLIADGSLFLIDKTTPQAGRTQFTLLEPQEAFKRPLLYASPANAMMAGDFLAKTIKEHFIVQSDPVYAMPYLQVESSGAVAFVEPEIDDKGCFDLPSYIRLLRRLSNLDFNFVIEEKGLRLQFSKGSSTARQIVFGGASQLSTAVYSKSGLAKLTVLQPLDTGMTDANGEPIYETVAKDFYLSESGEVSESIPARRAEGGWDTISVNAKQEPLEKARETFAKNKKSHRVEFYSQKDMSVFDPCIISLYGEQLSSFISYKGKSSTDSRYFYKSGELATKASEKLRSI